MPGSGVQRKLVDCSLHPLLKVLIFRVGIAREESVRTIEEAVFQRIVRILEGIVIGSDMLQVSPI